jgi:hypothetical protein
MNGGATVGNINANANGCTFGGDVIISHSVDGYAMFQITNPNAGTTARGGFNADNGTSSVVMEMPGASFTTAGPRVAGRGYIWSDGGAGLTVHAVNQLLRFWTGNPGTEAMTIERPAYGQYVTINSTVAGSAYNVGALVVAGGVGIGGALYTGLGAYIGGNVLPSTDNTYYFGKNDDDTPFAWKGVCLKDTTNGKYYRVEVISGVVTATDLTD